MSSGPSRRMKIGEFLLRRLQEAGVRHLFGVPGDYNLELLQQLQDIGSMKWIGTCSELNASYAADGYARLNGMGALLVTNGVGALSAINGVGGSYSEHVPVICISDRYRSDPSTAAWGCTTQWPTGALTTSSTPMHM
jgi:indolepyruvate decarboxylase